MQERFQQGDVSSWHLNINENHREISLSPVSVSLRRAGCICWGGRGRAGGVKVDCAGAGGGGACGACRGTAAALITLRVITCYTLY